MYAPPLICQICGKKGHIAFEYYHRNNYSYQLLAPPASITAMTAQGSQEFNPNADAQQVHDFNGVDTWVLDTGATHHMTVNMENLNQTRPYNGEEKIIIGNGQGL